MLLEGKHIFIVEDDMKNRKVYSMVLAATHGARLEFDRWAPGALERLQAFCPVDLIILDLMFLMGGISGYEIIREIRGVEALAQVPVVAISAAEPSHAIAKTKHLGFNGFIAKPVSDELLPQQLLQVLSGQPVWYAGERFQGLSATSKQP